ncbi:MAG: RNA helicase [Clostridiales bacterium]|nr:RNA helicase [Clostridiales bacterium]MCF8022424.1 RNA helicase [Clostridiales bacterium]
MFKQSACVEIIESVQENLPALYFVFSRGKAEALAEELGREWDFLLPEEKDAVEKAVSEYEQENSNLFTDRRKNLRRLLLQGIGYHHAGISPAIKELVENLYEERLIFVLFCTETFAVGINFPAASTIFESTRKWDGETHRNLMNREFFQMAGRAGRRGYDKVGRVYVRLDEKYLEQTGFFDEDQVEPVQGKLFISPNTVLSLLCWKTDEEIQKFLSQNLAVYQTKKETKRLSREIEEIDFRMEQLKSNFCQDRDTPVCPMFRANLKKELNKIRRKKHKKKMQNIFPGREEQIKSILAQKAKNCAYQACNKASDEIKTLKEQKSYLVRRNKQLDRQAENYPKDFDRMVQLLNSLGYVEGRDLLPRGKFALYIHVQELFVTELVFSGIIQEVSLAEVAAILAGIDYYPGRDEVVLPGEYEMDEVGVLQNELKEMNVPENLRVWSPLPGPLAESWYNGATFEQLIEKCNLHEGDIFSLLRREIDLLRQMERACGENRELREKLYNLRRSLDRDEIAIIL